MKKAKTFLILLLAFIPLFIPTIKGKTSTIKSETTQNSKDCKLCKTIRKNLSIYLTKKIEKLPLEKIHANFCILISDQNLYSENFVENFEKATKNLTSLLFSFEEFKKLLDLQQQIELQKNYFAINQNSSCNICERLEKNLLKNLLLSFDENFLQDLHQQICSILEKQNLNPSTFKLIEKKLSEILSQKVYKNCIRSLEITDSQNIKQKPCTKPLNSNPKDVPLLKIPPITRFFTIILIIFTVLVPPFLLPVGLHALINLLTTNNFISWSLAVFLSLPFSAAWLISAVLVSTHGLIYMLCSLSEGGNPLIIPLLIPFLTIMLTLQFGTIITKIIIEKLKEQTKKFTNKFNEQLSKLYNTIQNRFTISSHQLNHKMKIMDRSKS